MEWKQLTVAFHFSRGWKPELLGWLYRALRDLMSAHLGPKLSASFTGFQLHWFLSAKSTKHTAWLEPLAVCFFLLEGSCLRLSTELPSSSAPMLCSNTF